MDLNKNNYLIKLLLETKTKPNFSKYTLEQLTQMYLEFIKNKNNISNNLFLEKEYSKKTINIINSICFDIESVENQKIQNLILENEVEYLKKKILINYLNGLWKKIPIIDEFGEITECVICLNHITNCDNICFQCEHKTHSTCFFNYLFTNLKNIYNNSNNSNNYDNSNDSTIHHNLIKLFRCPNCRNYLTDTICEYINEYTNENTNENLNMNLNVNIEQQYGDEFNNFILQEYNLSANNNDHMLNGFFRLSNNSNIFSNYIDFMTFPNIMIDNQDYDNYISSSGSINSSINDFDSFDDDNN